ncbi:hypothetical protein TNCV_1654381 [Trichonephila clavipes]|nr:hypothetical protein TNCV_1654381 [Trichonephila clavipes]
MDDRINEITSLQHRSTNHYENWHVQVFLCGEGFCAILFAAAPHQVALRQINFCAVQSTTKLPNKVTKNDANLALSRTFHYISIESPL